MRKKTSLNIDQDIYNEFQQAAVKKFKSARKLGAAFEEALQMWVKAQRA